MIDNKVEKMEEEQDLSNQGENKKDKPKSLKNRYRLTQQKSSKCELVLVPADQCESKSDTSIDQFRFWSTFDNGNLSKVIQSEDNPSRFKVWLGIDCAGRQPPLIHNKNFRQWFYFKVHNMEQQARMCEISIENLEPTQFSKIWKADRDIYFKIHDKQKQWLRKPIISLDIEGKSNMKVLFELNIPADTVVSVAYCVPWSFQHNQKYITKIQKKMQSQDLYFVREVICKSFEGRVVEIITLTSKTKQCQEYEEAYGDQMMMFPNRQNTQRPHKFAKQYLYLTCRVHPAEAPASFIMKGVLDFLSVSSQDSQAFLDNFVLILIPMLNPDGVYRGHYRLDAIGYDLNRVYNRLYKKSNFPAQYALLETSKYYGPRLAAYIDIHAHSQISNSFMLLNKHPCEIVQKEILIIPQFMSFFLDHFNLNSETVFQLTKLKTPIEEIEGQHTEDPSFNPDQLCWHESKQIIWEQQHQKIRSISQNSDSPIYQVEDNEESKAQSPIQSKKTAFQYVEGFSGIAKQDVFYSSCVNLCYTLETNYRYYIIKDGDEKIKKKFSPQHFCKIGEAVILSVLELKELRDTRSILNSQGIQNLDALKEIVGKYIQ